MAAKTREQITKEILKHGEKMGFPTFPKKTKKPNNKKN